MESSLPDSPRWWQWPTILSLDAPTVVVTWQYFFARAAGVHLGWAEGAVLGTSVWLAYVADRWFEGWRVPANTLRTPRHRFYRRHRWSVAIAWALGLSFDLYVTFSRFTKRELLWGTMLLIPALVYVLSHQLIHRHRRWRLPKEICIALLLAGGSVVFVMASPGLGTQPLTVPVAFFAALCLSNVALIAAWEQEIDEVHGQVSLARQFRGAAGASRVFPWVIAFAAISWTIGGKDSRPAAECVVASAVLLGLLDRVERRFGWELARVLADAVLLTPLVPLFARR